jgi:hypothetical protein
LQVAHADSFSDQPRHAVSPFVVQPFDQTGFSTALATRPVLPRREQLAIRLVKVGIDQLFTIASGQREPELPQALKTAIPDPKANDLMRETRDGNPQIQIAPLKTVTYYQFVHFKGIAFDGGQESVGKTQTRLLGFFWAKARIVVRATLKVRAMARWESLSPRAASIKASLATDNDRLRAWGVQVFLHA